MQLSSLKLLSKEDGQLLVGMGFPNYSVADFKMLQLVLYEALEWVWELLAIKGIRNFILLWLFGFHRNRFRGLSPVRNAC